MKFSIITIHYNEKDVAQTCESITNQTYKDFQWIVVDGGSEQEYLNIINNYKDKISVLISEKDKGVYNAMNKGIAQATGDYIIFLNAGDYFYDNNVLENVANEMEKTKNVDFYFGDVCLISENKKYFRIQKQNDFYLKNTKSLYYKNINHQTIFYKKTLFNKLGFFNEDLKIYADWDFNIKCFYKRKTKYKYLPIIISCYQLGGKSSQNIELRSWEKSKIDDLYYQDTLFLNIDKILYKYFRTPYRFFKKLKMRNFN